MEWLEKYVEFNSPKKRIKFFKSHVVNMHQGDLLFCGGFDPAILAEIEDSFKRGNFVACVLLCQLVIEHALASIFLLTEHESITTKGFAKLIAKAEEVGAIDCDMESQLTELRKMRNPYVHPKFGDGQGTYIRRVLDKKMDYNEMPISDGIEAVRTLGDFINRKID